MTAPRDPFMHRQIEVLLNRDPVAVVEVTVASWSQLMPLLTAIVGEGGFEPLYSRSVRQAAVLFPWLTHRLSAPTSANRFADLQVRLQAVDLAEAKLASALHLQLFLGMLASLIGEQLTARLLQTAWPEDTPPTFREE